MPKKRRRLISSIVWFISIGESSWFDGFMDWQKPAGGREFAWGIVANLHAKRGQPGEVQGTGLRRIPSKPAPGLLDRQIVDACMPMMHQAVEIKFPVLI